MRRLRFLIWILCSSVIALSRSNAENLPIKIGYLLDLSGKGAFIGQQSQAGALLAQQELKKRGIDVVLLFEDHRTDGKTAVSGAQKLLNIDKVGSILCDLTAPCIAAAGVVKKAKVLFFYQSPSLSILETAPNSYKNFLDYELGCRKITEYWVSKGIARIAHLKANAEFGELCLKGSQEIFPAQLVIEYDSGTDLSSAVARLKAANVQAILQTGYEADFISRFRSSQDIGLTALIGMPEPVLTDAVLASISPAAFEQLVVFGFRRIPPEFEQSLRDAKLYRSLVSLESAAIAYLQVMQATHATKACSPSDLSCQQRFVNSSMEGSRNLGFLGWKNRQAQYEMVLRTAEGKRLHDIGSIR